MSLICVPIPVETREQTLRDAAIAAEHGADLIELRVDAFAAQFDPETDDCAAAIRGMIAAITSPVILTCRHRDEGGAYDGNETDRVSLLEAVCVNAEHPPAYLDFELAAYRSSANLRQKIDFCVAHPKQQREVRTRLILSMHDFNGRPRDLTRRLVDAWSEPAAAVVKFAFRARSIRDNLEIFEILRDAPKPTIGLGMGEFGLMSRVLAPKFGGYLTFASLRDTAATAPGQPTIHDLLGMYRFRSIGRDTKVYGVIGWPVSHSMGPLIHNAGFEAVGWDGVYLPLPVAADENDPSASDASFKATFAALSAEAEPLLSGASVTIPHKSRLHNAATEHHLAVADSARITGVANTFVAGHGIANTDAEAIATLLADPSRAWTNRRVALVGAGGVAVAAGITLAALGATVVIHNRTAARAESLAKAINASLDINGASLSGKAVAAAMDLLPEACCDTFINCTPVGMTGGPEPDGLSIPIPDLNNVDAGTVFFDTVYNPIETPMLKAARERGCRTIDGVQMFIRQAAAQFGLWTGQPAPVELFDRLVRERLNAGE